MARRSGEDEPFDGEADSETETTLISGELLEIPLRSALITLPQEPITINGTRYRIEMDAEAMAHAVTEMERLIPDVTWRGRATEKPELQVNFPLVDLPPGMNPLSRRKEEQPVTYHQRAGTGVVDVRLVRGLGHDGMSAEQLSKLYQGAVNDSLTYGLLVHLAYSGAKPRRANLYKTGARAAAGVGGAVSAGIAGIERLWPFIWRSSVGAAAGAGVVGLMYGASRMELFLSREDRILRACNAAQRNRYAALYAIDPIALVAEASASQPAETNGSGTLPADEPGHEAVRADERT
jgi:hypothetical protein